MQVEKEDRDKTMWDAIACFSAGSPLGADKQAAKPKVDKEDPLQVIILFFYYIEYIHNAKRLHFENALLWPKFLAI